MNIGDKSVKFIPAIVCAFFCIIMFKLASVLYSRLNEHDQLVVAITLSFAIGVYFFNATFRKLDWAQDGIEDGESREDGLATKYPSYGHLRAAHREVNS